MLAELRRTALRFGIAPERLLPRAVYRCDIAIRQCLDLRDQGNREEVGLSPDAIRSEDPRRCQDVAMAAHYLGIEGLIAPSATGTGSTIAIFTDRLHADSCVEPRDVEIWSTLPVF